MAEEKPGEGATYGAATDTPEAPPKGARRKSRKAKPKGRPPGRNWAKIKAQWNESPLELETFLRAKQIPLSTGKRYLSIAEKNKTLKESKDAATKFRERLASMMGKEEARLHVQALKHVNAAVTEVLLDSAEDFKGAHGKLPKEKAGRLIIAAGDMLLRTALELQGIPDEDDLDGWPLSRMFRPFSYQRDFIFDTPSSVRLETHGAEDPFVFPFIGGVGSGKTLCGAQKAGQLAWLNRGHVGMICAPTYPMLRDATKATFIKVLTDKGLSFTHLKTENAIILFGDTKILFRSLDDPDHLRGPNIAWAWLDEPGQLPDRNAFDVINARIRGDDKPEKALIITTTPDGLNWLYDVCVTEAAANRVRMYRARTRDNPTLGDYEQRLRSSYDPKFASQELDAEFLSLIAGKAYWQFSSVENVFEPSRIKISDGAPLDLCCDFNVSPMCWNVSQDLPHEGEQYTYVHDELHVETAGTDLVVQEFLNRWGDSKAVKNAGIRVWGDATGQFKGTSASRSDYEIIEKALKKHFGNHAVEINIGRSNPRQRDRVLSVNGRLLNDLGRRRLYVSKACKHTLVDFERTAFIPGTQELDKSQTRAKKRGGKTSKADLTHHTDAIGYKVWRQWPIREVSEAIAA